MCGYDPFKWADIYSSEEEYIKELEQENDAQNNRNKRSDELAQRTV